MVVAHAVGDDGGHQRFDRAQHGDGEGGTKQAVDEVGAEFGDHEVRQAAGDSAKARADGFDRKLEKIDSQRSQRAARRLVPGYAAKRCGR